jgi:hypothetical protein
VTYFALYAVVGLIYFWAMALNWSVSAGPSSIGTVIGMLVSSLLAATSGMWLFNKKAGALVTLALMAFFVIWLPIMFAIHGFSLGDIAFYAVVLVLFFVPARIFLRAHATVPPSFTRAQSIGYAIASLIALVLAILLSLGLWQIVFSSEFWQNVSSHPDVWGLRAH